jgi:hypothetical protein
LVLIQRLDLERISSEDAAKISQCVRGVGESLIAESRINTYEEGPFHNDVSVLEASDHTVSYSLVSRLTEEVPSEELAGLNLVLLQEIDNRSPVRWRILSKGEQQSEPTRLTVRSRLLHSQPEDPAGRFGK